MEVLQENPIAIPSTLTSRRHKTVLWKKCWHFRAQIAGRSAPPPPPLWVGWNSRALGKTHASSFLPACSEDSKLHHHLWMHLPSPQEQHTQSCSVHFPRGGRASRQPGPSATGCCRGKSLAAKAQPSPSFPVGDQAPAFPHSKQNFQPKAILGGSQLKCRTSLQWKY